MVPACLQNERGLTITELMVAVLLSSIAAGILFLNHLFFNATTINWQQNLAAEIDIERMVNAVDFELRNLTALDTVFPSGLRYRNRAGRERMLRFDRDTLIVPGASTAGLKRVRLDSASFRVLPDTGAIGRGENSALAFAALDKNSDGVLCGNELFSVDFLLCNLHFSFGRNFDKRFSVEIGNRLLNRPIQLKEF